MAIKTQKKKKKWYPIFAPVSFRGQLLGEILSSGPESIVGKNLSLNLMEFTNDPKKQNFRANFKVVKMEGEKAVTQITGYEMLLTHVRRIMRKGIEKVEDSFVAKSKDGVNVQVKTLLLTKSKTKHSVLTAIRKTTRDFISNELKNYSFDEFIQLIIATRIQKQLRESLNKIYPLVACEFRIVKRS